MRHEDSLMTHMTPPPHLEIVRYWEDRSEFARAMENAPACFACCDGSKTWKILDRAHIIARSQGGSYCPSNFLLLCCRCHKEQPMLTDREMVIGWAQAHAHFSDFIIQVMQREEAFYGPGFRFNEVDESCCQRLLRLKSLRFHPNATMPQKFDAVAYMIREYVKLRDLHEKVFL